MNKNPGVPIQILLILILSTGLNIVVHGQDNKPDTVQAKIIELDKGWKLVLDPNIDMADTVSIKIVGRIKKFIPMSSFRIYQIDHFDPKSAGQKKRRLVVCIAILSLLFALVFIVCLNAFKINMSLFIAVWTPLYAGFFLYLNYRIRSDLKHIKVIGEIEFTRTCIKKRIGDSFTEYDFQSINKLELQKHFPTLHINDSKSGYFSYILKITFTNFSSESLVVSDKPTDSKLDICIVETMKTLKRIIKPEITIET